MVLDGQKNRLFDIDLAPKNDEAPIRTSQTVFDKLSVRTVKRQRSKKKGARIPVRLYYRDVSCTYIRIRIYNPVSQGDAKIISFEECNQFAVQIARFVWPNGYFPADREQNKHTDRPLKCARRVHALSLLNR